MRGGPGRSLRGTYFAHRVGLIYAIFVMLFLVKTWVELGMVEVVLYL